MHCESVEILKTPYDSFDKPWLEYGLKAISPVYFAAPIIVTLEFSAKQKTLNTPQKSKEAFIPVTI